MSYHGRTKNKSTPRTRCSDLEIIRDCSVPIKYQLVWWNPTRSRTSSWTWIRKTWHWQQWCWGKCLVRALNIRSCRTFSGNSKFEKVQCQAELSVRRAHKAAVEDTLLVRIPWMTMKVLKMLIRLIGFPIKTLFALRQSKKQRRCSEFSIQSFNSREIPVVKSANTRRSSHAASAEIQMLLRVRVPTRVRRVSRFRN